MMDALFDIKFKIGQKEKESLKEIKHIQQFRNDVSPDGWILINIGNYKYGFLQDDPSIDGFELLDEWFLSFKDIYNKLIPDSKHILDYWDEPNEFFVFERKNNRVRIQYFEKEFKEDGDKIYSEVNTSKQIAETVVSEELFFNLIKEKVNEFWNEVGNLNLILKEYVEQFKIK